MKAKPYGYMSARCSLTQAIRCVQYMNQTTMHTPGSKFFPPSELNALEFPHRCFRVSERRQPV